MKKINLVLILVAAAPAFILVACDSHKSTAVPNTTSAVETNVPNKTNSQGLTPNQQCAVDMCGPAENYMPIQAGGAFRNLVPIQVKKILKNEIDPALNQLADIAVKVRTQRMNTLEKISQRKDLDFSQFTDAQQSVIVLMATLLQLSPQLDQIASVGIDGVLKIDAEKLTKARPDWTADFATQAAAAFNLYFSNSDVRSGNNISKLSFDVFSRIMKASSPNATLSLLSWLYATQIGTAVNQLGPYVTVDLDMDLITKMGDNTPLTEREKAQIMKIIGRIYSMNGFIDSSITEAFLALKISLADILKNYQLDQRLKVNRELLNSPTRLQAARKNIIESCHQSIIQALAAAPTEFRQRKAMELMERVKVASKTAAASYLSGVALLKARAAIDKVGFSPPTSLDGIKAGLQESMIAGKKQALLNQTLIQATQDKDENWQSFLMMSLVESAPKKDEDVFSTIQDLCGEFAPPSFVDRAAAMANLIQMGWQTVTFPEIGAGVIAHEIGHIVSAEVAAGEATEIRGYSTARECTLDIHKNLMLNQTGIAKDSQFQEEDWADAFAATSLKELQKTWPYAKNFGCALLSLDEAKNSFGSLDLSNINSADTHSQDLLRTLNTQMNLNLPVPASCQPMIAAAMGNAPKACAQ